MTNGSLSWQKVGRESDSMWPKKVAPINNFLKVIQYVGGKKKSNAFIVSGSVSFLKWYWVNMG